MCIFCEIAKGNIPCHKLYEDDSVIAFFDINPTSYGHTLVIPKEHCDSFLTCPSSTLEHVLEVAQTLAKQLKTNLNCDGINILSNVGETAGQTIPHFHIHIIPRYEDSLKDNVQISFGEIGTLDFEALLANTTR